MRGDQALHVFFRIHNKSQVIDPNSRPNCTHKSVVIGITMPKSKLFRSVPRHSGDSSTSPGYHTKVPNQARRPKNLKIGQMHENDEIPQRFPNRAKTRPECPSMPPMRSYSTKVPSKTKNQKPRYICSLSESSRNSQALMFRAYLSIEV